MNEKIIKIIPYSYHAYDIYDINQQNFLLEKMNLDYVKSINIMKQRFHFENLSGIKKF